MAFNSPPVMFISINCDQYSQNWNVNMILYMMNKNMYNFLYITHIANMYKKMYSIFIR